MNDEPGGDEHGSTGRRRPPDDPDPWFDERWSSREWRRERSEAWRRRSMAWRDRHPEWRRRRGRGAGCLWFAGCLILFLVLVLGTLTALATWVAGAVLGIVAPEARPSSLVTLAAIGLLVLVMVSVVRVLGTAIRPITDLASAADRLADGEPDVRVRPRGPRPVRGLAVSFNSMAARLDRSREDRRALLADVTHELRTPLTVISGGIEAMLDGVHPIDAGHLAPILAEAKVMDRLLDDLRTVSLAEAGALPVHREPVDLRDLAAEVVAAHATAAMATGVDLRATAAEPVPADVDPVRVREILVNLVTNALRHTPSGGTVSVEARRDGDEALLVVRDTGEGIPAADLPRVFDRFHRRADSGGSGLGLTIARDLATAHGGSITAESAGIPGRGSTFTVRLPTRD